jgi:hypothetical protein
MIAAMHFKQHTSHWNNRKILQYGKELLEKPIVLRGVEETLAALHGKYN